MKINSKFTLLSLLFIFAVGCGASKEDQLVAKLDEFLKVELAEDNITTRDYEKIRFATNHKNFFLVKITYDKGTEEEHERIAAFNLDNFNADLKGKELSDWMNSFTDYDLGDGYDFSKNVTFVEYDDSVGDYSYDHDSDGLPLILEETTPSTKDLEKAGAIIEGLKRKNVAEGLSYEFGLSEERAYEIAKLSENWKKISNSRQMTEADANLFLNEAIGASYNLVRTAMTESAQGDETSYNSLIDIASEKNEIDPEHMRELVDMIIN